MANTRTTLKRPKRVAKIDAAVRQQVATDLRALLDAAGVTQRGAAERLGMAAPSVNIKLNGTQNLTLLSIVELAALGGMRPVVRFVHIGRKTGD